jgi:hypothetical protein
LNHLSIEYGFFPGGSNERDPSVRLPGMAHTNLSRQHVSAAAHDDGIASLDLFRRPIDGRPGLIFRSWPMVVSIHRDKMRSYVVDANHFRCLCSFC